MSYVEVCCIVLYSSHKRGHYAGRDGNLVVTDRQLDRLALYSTEGTALLSVNMSLMGKPSSATQLASGELVVVREKANMCVFAANGRDKRIIKETLSKPCCVAQDKDGNFLVLDYDLKTASIYSSQSYTRTSQVSTPRYNLYSIILFLFLYYR